MTDILAMIDAATQSLCACGCGTRLPEDGPSAWFAAQDCQRRWNESRATDPGDVYNRPDAGDDRLRDAMVSNASGPDHGAALDFMASMVNPEALMGRTGIVTAIQAGPDGGGSWADSAMAAWLRANLASDNIRLRLDTTPLVDASPTATYSCTTPDGILSYTESSGFAAFDGASGRDEWMEWSPFTYARSVGIPCTASPGDALLMFGNVYIVDETHVAATARRSRLRKVHSDYSRRLRARRKRR